jgi:riboflavin kinase/FMN adenylyltransferase
MLILDDVNGASAQCRSAVVAIGNFDGVHRGHRQLMQVAAGIAEEKATPWGVVTFEPHPRELFRPDQPVFRLTPRALKCRLFEGLGADFTAVLAFDKQLASLEPEQFVTNVLVDGLGVTHVVTGYDFHFGQGRKGSPQTMIELGARHGFSVTVVEQVTDDNGIAPFASSSIRAALRHGRIAEAGHQLGYWWTVIGEVVKGDQRGRTIGYPTANIVLPAGCEPAEGIYALRVRKESEPCGKIWHAAGYIGKRPTFSTDRSFLEAFLFDFDGDLYGQSLIVEFIDFIRPDHHFDTVEELTAQMDEDCRQAARLLAEAESQADVMSFLDRAAGAGGQ